MDSQVGVGFTGSQDAAFPSIFPLMIGAVRKNLSFQTHAGPQWVDLSALSLERSIQVITGIKLNTRLIGVNFHDAT